MADIVQFPGGANPETISGQPRPDIAQMFRDLADRAEKGELDAMAVAASVSDAGFVLGYSTPENCPYAIVGALYRLIDQVKDRIDQEEAHAPRSHTEYDQH